MITISNSIFEAKGADKKAQVYGVILSGNEDVIIENCEFKNTGYSGVLNKCTGNVTIKNCKFDCANIYNPIEGAQEVANGNVIVEDCQFLGAPGNNYINFYRVANGSVHNVAGCHFEPTVDNNIIRLSNRNNANATFHITDCDYTFAIGDPTDYTAFLLCQDYTNKSGNKQDFSKYLVNIENVKCEGVALSAETGAAKGSVYYVYEDGAGIIETNNPVVKIN